ncbi:hypothetical protein [Aetokthonos hydrillicola]|jgi:hypothetical protein|nr:hypothetical protein [Aetokthonos hydrillicola CCALA 1050]
MFQYLLENHRSGRSGTEIVEDAASAFWMPMVMKKHGVSGEELEEAGLWAIEQLLGRVGTIMAICGIKKLPPSLLLSLGATSVPMASGETTTTLTPTPAAIPIDTAKVVANASSDTEKGNQGEESDWNSDGEEESAELEVEEDTLWNSMTL